MSNFHPIEDVGCGSETQQMCENVNQIIWREKGLAFLYGSRDISGHSQRGSRDITEYVFPQKADPTFEERGRRVNRNVSGA